MKTWLLPGLLVGVALAAPLFTLACTSDTDDQATPSEDDEIKKKKLAKEGEACSAQKACETGLLCKAQSSGPPPGAVGLPAPVITCGGPPPNARCAACPGGATGYKQYNGEPSCDCCESSGPPPGAVGLPAPNPQPNTTCQKPGPGELGGKCSNSIPCNPGLVCKYASGGGASFPPGAMGMPAPRTGTCQESGGPPPGAVGLPAPSR